MPEDDQVHPKIPAAAHALCYGSFNKRSPNLSRSIWIYIYVAASEGPRSINAVDCTVSPTSPTTASQYDPGLDLLYSRPTSSTAPSS